MRANPTLIGAFVIGGVALAVAAVLIFGSGEALARKERFILYFREPVQGLVPGSPVTMFGVRVGEVEEVLLEYVEQNDEFRTPVTIVVFTNRFSGVDVDRRTDQDDIDLIRRMVKKGYRATLVSESLITGRLGIAFDLHPDREAVFVGGDDPPYPELPTTTAGLRAFMKEVENLPLSEVFEDIRRAIQAIEKRVNSDEITEVLASTDTAIDEFAALGRTLNEKAGPAIEGITAAGASVELTFDEARTTVRNLDEHLATLSKQLNSTLASIEKLSDDLDVEVAPTAEEARTALEKAGAALEKIESAAAELAALLGRDSAAVKELRKALAEIASAARAFKSLSQTLEREPESILKGKRGDN